MFPDGFRGLVCPPEYRLELAFLLGRMLPFLSRPIIIDRIRDKTPMVSLHVSGPEGWKAVSGDFDVVAEGKDYHRGGDLVCWEARSESRHADVLVLSREAARLRTDCPVIVPASSRSEDRSDAVGAASCSRRRILWPGDAWDSCGPADVCGMPNRPEFEIEVAVLLGLWLSESGQGCVVEEATDKFPDMRLWWQERGEWKQLRVELELLSDSFVKHGHDVTGCDWIVCWSDTWRDCPLDVFSLDRAVEGVRPKSPSPARAAPRALAEGELARLERFEGVTAATAVRELLTLCHELEDRYPRQVKLRRNRREWNLYWNRKTILGFDAGTGRVVRWEKYLVEMRVPVKLRDDLMNWIEGLPGHFLREPGQVTALRPILERLASWLMQRGEAPRPRGRR